MVAERGKKAKADAELDSSSSQLVIAVKKLQEELEKINEDESEKVLEVEQKYNQVRRPIYARRNEVIQFLCHPMLGELLNEEDHK